MSKLTAVGIKRLVEPGRYGDGGGLWLQVRDGAHRSWLFRYKAGGKERQMGLGPYPDTSLAEARDAATTCRRLLRDGADPIDYRAAERKAKAAKRNVATFEQVAARYIAAHKAGWRSHKQAQIWETSLSTYAFPTIGKLAVNAVDTESVKKILEPIWRTKTETAARLRGRIQAVLDYATAQGSRTGDNPARWNGHLSNLLPAPRAVVKVVHHPALPYAELPAFVARVSALGGATPLALQLVILTAARTNEVLGARWQEFDRDKAVWTVPGERMKAGRQHRVPLSRPALAILDAMLPPKTKPADFVFPGSGKAGHMSNMALTVMLRRMGRSDITVHGFRSTFRDWAAETTPHPREVAEKALAHTLKDKVEGAYQRGDLLDKRVLLMADWGAFCCSIKLETP